MPEWRQLTRAHLTGLGLDPEREEEIRVELAQHLAAVYEEWRQHGAFEDEALDRALAEVPDWAELCREIYQAEHGENAMNQRTKSLWLPGLATLLVAMGALAFFDWAGFRPSVIYSYRGGTAFLFVHLPWLVTLPAAGALGAYWSRRAGGRLRERVLAGVFPAATLAALLATLLPVGLVIDWHVPLGLQLYAFATTLLSAAVIPAAALLLGALPFLPRPPREGADVTA